MNKLLLEKVKENGVVEIIMDYKEKLEHRQKLSNVLKEMKKSPLLKNKFVYLKFTPVITIDSDTGAVIEIIYYDDMIVYKNSKDKYFYIRQYNQLYSSKYMHRQIFPCSDYFNKFYNNTYNKTQITEQGYAYLSKDMHLFL